MASVWKFQVNTADEVETRMPRGARVLSVGEQRGVVYIWALVDPAEPTEPRRFRIAGTGHSVAPEHIANFVGAFHMMGGNLVFHVFDITEFAVLDRQQDTATTQPQQPDVG